MSDELSSAPLCTQRAFSVNTLPLADDKATAWQRSVSDALCTLQCLSSVHSAEKVTTDLDSLPKLIKCLRSSVDKIRTKALDRFNEVVTKDDHSEYGERLEKDWGQDDAIRCLSASTADQAMTEICAYVRDYLNNCVMGNLCITEGDPSNVEALAGVAGYSMIVLNLLDALEVAKTWLDERDGGAARDALINKWCSIDDTVHEGDDIGTQGEH